MAKLVRIGSWVDPALAEVAAQVLRRAGIPVVVDNQYTSLIDPWLASAAGGAALLVPEQCLEQALELLDAVVFAEDTAAGEPCASSPPAGIENVEEGVEDDVEASAPRCPACGSYDHDCYRPYLWLMVLLPVLFFLASVRRCVCRSCGCRYRP